MAKSPFDALREQLFLEPSTSSRPSETIANRQAVEDVKSSSVEGVGSSVVQEDKAAAATKIQALVRRYIVRSRTPLIHLSKIYSVKEKFGKLREKVEDPLYMENISVHYMEYRKFMDELFDPLLFDLDALQGVHPVVRDFQQSVIHELVEFREVIDTSVVFASHSWIDTVTVGRSNSIAHTDGVSDSSPKRMHSLDDKLTLSEQSYKRQHLEHPNGKGKAPQTPALGEEDEMTKLSLHVSGSHSSFGDRKGKAVLETPVAGAGDDISLGEMLEYSLGGSSSRSSELTNYGPILTSSLREVVNVRARIKELSDLLSCPNFHLKLRSDKMEQLKVTDCITALFLQLESLQVEDEAVQDICESVSTEVANLQKLVYTIIQ